MPIKRYESEEEYFARLKKRHAREQLKARGEQYSVSELPDGSFEVRGKESGFTAVLNEDGSYRYGGLDKELAEEAFEKWLLVNSEPLELGLFKTRS